MENSNQFPPKDPSAILDYQFDWAAQSNNNGLSDWLESGETIVSHEITVPAGITVVSSSLINNNTTVVVWLSGGTAGTDYLITCKIITATRTDSRSRLLPVRTR